MTRDDVEQGYLEEIILGCRYKNFLTANTIRDDSRSLCSGQLIFPLFLEQISRICIYAFLGPMSRLDSRWEI